MNDININDISMYGEHGVEMIDDNTISRNTTFSSEKIDEKTLELITAIASLGEEQANAILGLLESLKSITATVNTRAPADTALSTAQWTNARATAIDTINTNTARLTQARADAIDTINTNAARVTQARGEAIDRIGNSDNAANAGVTAGISLFARLRALIDRIGNSDNAANAGVTAGISLFARLRSLLDRTGANDVAASATGSINAKSAEIISRIGASNNAANATNDAGVSIFARLRSLMDRTGANDAAANATGNINAKLREIIDNRLGAVNATGGTATAGSANAKLNALLGQIGASGSRANIRVQRGQATIQDHHTSVNVNITSVPLYRSFIVATGTGSSDSFSGFRVAFYSQTVLHLHRMSFGQAIVNWFVITFD